MVDWNAVELNDVLSMIVWESVVIRIMFNTDQYDGMLMMEENNGLRGLGLSPSLG